MHESENWKGSRSVMSDSSQPHGLQPTRLLCPWDFLGKRTGVGCHRLLHSMLSFTCFFGPWTARSNQSILKEINSEYSLEGLMLKLQSFGHLIQTADSLEKILILGKIEGRRRRWRWNGCMAPMTQWTWVWASSRRWWRTGKPGVLQSMGSQRVRHDWATELNRTSSAIE